MSTSWREAIEKAGGVESALLHGPALKALVDELAATTAERDAAITLEAETREREQRHACTSASLRAEIERAVAAMEIGARVLDATRERAERAEAVVAALRRERELATVSNALDGALVAYDGEEPA